MLTEREAFEAMRYFLAQYWQRGGSQSESELPTILGSTSIEIWADGSTADPAQYDDWLDAVETVRRGERA